MPEFATVSMSEAKRHTAPGRQGRILSEYAPYIRQLSPTQAGRLRAVEGENPLTIRRHVVTAAKALGIALIIKRSGQDIYFWRQDGEAERPRRKRRYTRQTTRQAETPQQYFQETGAVQQGTPVEESPELGQTPE